MKFFIPHATEVEQEEVYEAIRRFVAESLSWPLTESRIFAVRYRHNGKEALAQVGERDIDGEIVLAIFESNAYVVCTPNRGGFRGDPILIGTDEASDVERFD